jgi:hypothetical protein
VSRQSDAKKARRKKRQASRDALWIPEPVHQRLAEELEIAAELEDFADRLDERGWAVSDSDDDEPGVIWFFPPSFVAEVEDGMVEATVVVLLEDDGGEIAHVIFVGTDERFEFDLEELFEHLDTIEAYRLGDPAPTLNRA